MKLAARCRAAFQGGFFSEEGGSASCGADASPVSGAFSVLGTSRCETEPLEEVPCPALILATSISSRLRGLVGRSGFEGSCLIAPCCDIHTFGMRESVDAAFIDAGGRVLAVRRGLPPGRRVRVRGAACTLERFAREGLWLNEGDMLVLSVQRFGDASGSELVEEEGRRL